MDDLVTWLRAQLDEDERVALAAEGSCWHVEYCDDGMAGFHDRHDPARVLAEVAANRAIVDLHDNDGGAHECPDGKDVTGPYTGYERDCLTLRHLAAVYVDRPGYLEEWRPAATLRA